MQHRSKDGKLALPGGTDCTRTTNNPYVSVCKIEPSESVEDAAVHEDKEELGILITRCREVSSFTSGEYRLYIYEVRNVGVGARLQGHTPKR